MKAWTENTPQRARPKDKPFLMPVEDVFSISGRGTVCTGRIERGVIKVGEEVEIVGIRPTLKTVVTGVEMFRKLLDQGEAGDNVGCLLRGIDRDKVERGQVLCKPGSVKPHTKFKAEAYILTKEEGGRHTPFFTNYRPQFYFRTTDVTGVVTLPQGTEMVMPGDNIAMEVHLIVPIAMEEKLRFAIREGGRTVGAGVVASIIDNRTKAKGRGPPPPFGVERPRESRRESHERPEHPYPVEGVRPPHSRRLDARDRGDPQAHRRAGARAHPGADQDREIPRQPLAAHRQEEPRAVRDAHPQAPARYRRSDPADRRRADEARSRGRRRRRDQALTDGEKPQGTYRCVRE